MPPRQLTNRRPEDIGHTVKRLSQYMGRYRFLMLLSALLIFFSVMGNLLGHYMIKPIFNALLEENGRSVLIHGVTAAALFFFFGAIATLLYTQTVLRTSQKIVFDIRCDVFSHMQRLPLNFFDTKRHGDIMSYYTNDIDTVADACGNSYSALIKTGIQLFGTTAILIVLSWRLSIVVFIFYAIMFLYVRSRSKKAKSSYRGLHRSLGELDGFVQEMVHGQKVVKVFSREEDNLSQFDRYNEELRKAGTKAQSYSSSTVPAVMSLSFFNYAVVAFVGGLMVLDGSMDIGSLAGYLIFVRQTAWPINQFANQINFLLSALAGAERIFSILDAEPESDEGKTHLENADGMNFWNDGSRRTPVRGHVVLDHVTFGYSHERTVLDDVSIYAKPGQRIALVGSTGAGKTTVTNLLNRFYDIESGSITIDGIDVRDIAKKDLRSSMAMVLQDTHLFSGTIEDNIKFGNPDATHEDVVRAAGIAEADSFIRRLPDGYDTEVSNDGSNLSQGQRQLIAIARAAVADPSILILDEATSSIDTRTEDLIEKGMDRLMENRTVFVIAHRLSTVRNADAIMVIDNGRIAERGDHESLMAQKGLYYSLYMGMFELS